MLDPSALPSSPTTKEASPNVGGASLTPLYVWSLLVLSIVGIFVLVGLSKINWQEGLPVITGIIGIVAALAQPFEKKA